MLLVGLTGGIATGKTTVCNIFDRFGAYTIEADELGHEVIEIPLVKKRILDNFGRDILDEDGKIDRQKLSDRVFISEERIETLNELTHPVISKKIHKKIGYLEETNYPGIVIVEAALLPRWDLLEELDFLTIMEAPVWRRRERLIDKRGYSKDGAERRIEATEIDREELSHHIDFIIENIGTLDELRPKVVKVWMRLQAQLDYRR